MKIRSTFVLILLAVICLPILSRAQCVPDTSIGNGFEKSIRDACVGVAYDDTIHFAIADTYAIQGGFGTFVRPLNFLTIDNINFLPPGLNWECDVQNCTYATIQGQLVYGCIRVWGTPTAGSTMDSLELEITANVQGFQGPVNRPGNRNVGMVIGPFAGWTFVTAGNLANFFAWNFSATSYAWDFGDGNTSNAIFPVHTYAGPGNYNVCLTITDACGTGTLCQDVLVCEPLSANFTWNSLTGSTVQFTDISQGNAAAWQWDFGEQGPGNFSQQQNPSKSYQFPGYYYVCLEVTDSCGTIDTYCDSVLAVSVGIDAALQADVLLSPNPATSQVKLQGVSGATTLHVFNSSGKLMRRIAMENAVDAVTIDVSMLPTGIYFMHVQSDTGASIQKFVKM